MGIYAPSAPLFAQEVSAHSAASMEAVAAPLPQLGSNLTLPESLHLLDGSTFTGAQAQGRITVIYWWASTCPFCTLQSPEMQKLWLQHKGPGFQLLTLSIDKKAEDAIAYMQKRGYTFPVVWVSPAVHRALPKPRGLPVTLVRGRDGKVLQAERGQLFPEDVEAFKRWL